MGIAAAVFAVGVGAPVSAQRYPPAGIGSDSNTTPGGTNSNPTNNSNPTANEPGTEFFNPGPGGGGGGSGSPGSGTSDDEPACDIEHCLRYAGEVDGAFVAGKAQERGDLRVAALKGCCRPFSRVDVFVESERQHLGTVYAAEDGSYLGVFTLPASIKPGLHHVIADIEGCGELRGALEVLPLGAGAGDGDGTTVLGTTVRNTGVDGGGGILPRTGGDLFRLVMWALILVGLGTLLVLATRRLSERLAPVHAFGRRPRARRSIAALPPPEVPFVDTSRFVPYRSAPERRTLSRSSASTSRATSSAWTRAPKNEPPS